MPGIGRGAAQKEAFPCTTNVTPSSTAAPPETPACLRTRSARRFRRSCATGETAAESELLYVGFWTDKGNADADTLALLRTLKNKRLFLFGTAGFGIDTAYFDAILARVQAVSDGSNTVIGTYMCQGKMPPSVRARYEAMRALPAPPENLDALIENFDRARSHPDADDLDRLRAAVLRA